MLLYQIMVQYTRHNPLTGWKLSGGLPTFYLRDDMQGITSVEHAEVIARKMLETIAPDTTFHIAVSVSKPFDPSVIGA